MKNSELRVIPKKNYFILGVVILVTLCLVYYFYLWFNVYNESKLNMPILNKYMEVINYNEMGDYVIENPNTIVYVSVLEDIDIREFEKKIKNSYKKDKIVNEVLYMDLTKDIKKKSVIKEINRMYSIDSLSMVDVPCVVVFEDGIVSSIYSVKDNDYSIDKFESFVNGISFSGDVLSD